MQRGLKWKWVAVLFAFFGCFAAIGTGNLVQVNSITETISVVWGLDPLSVGIALSIVVGLVLIGGVKSIGRFAGIVVPFMALFYLAAGLFVITMHFDKIPEAFVLIFKSAFSGQAAIGAVAGTTIMTVIQEGVARSVFSNEAGMGISTFAAAAAQTDSPSRQGLITMTGALLSTVIVCSITGLVLAVTNVIGSTTPTGEPLTGANMAITAFNSTIWGGSYIVSIGLILFAFSTVISWEYYGEKCCEYLLGERSTLFYRLLFTLLVIPGSVLKMEVAWFLADILNGLMIIPNLIALIALSGVVVSETQLFIKMNGLCPSVYGKENELEKI